MPGGQYLRMVVERSVGSTYSRRCRICASGTNAAKCRSWLRTRPIHIMKVGSEDAVVLTIKWEEDIRDLLYSNLVDRRYKR